MSAHIWAIFGGMAYLKIAFQDNKLNLFLLQDEMLHFTFGLMPKTKASKNIKPL